MWDLCYYRGSECYKTSFGVMIRLFNFLTSNWHDACYHHSLPAYSSTQAEIEATIAFRKIHWLLRLLLRTSMARTPLIIVTAWLQHWLDNSSINNGAENFVDTLINYNEGPIAPIEDMILVGPDRGRKEATSLIIDMGSQPTQSMTFNTPTQSIM